MLGQVDEAIAWYDQAASHSPESDIYRRLAHLIAGNLEEAKREKEFTSEEDQIENEFCSIPLKLAIQWIEQQQK